jgi:hypothetical protein
VTEPAVAPVAEGEHEPTDFGMVFALSALCLVGPAMIATLLPFGRIIGLVLALAGFVVGLLALGSEGRARLAGALASVLHFGTLVVLLFLPSWLGLDSWGGPDVPEAPKGPLAVEAGGKTSPFSPGDWLSADKYSWQNRDVRVSVRAGVGPVELLGPKEKKRVTKESYLHLTLTVKNVGFERAIPLTGWAAGTGAEGVSVTDANGKALAPAAFEAGWAPVDRGSPVPRAMPEHGSSVVLLFAAPPAKTDYVRIQLSGAALGVENEIKFRAGTGPVLPRGPGQEPGR